MTEEIKNTLDEMRSAFDAKMQKLEEQQKAVEAREFAVAQAEARNAAPVVTEVKPQVSDLRAIANAMAEKRAITVGGTGNVAVARQIVKVVQDRHELLQKAKWFYGPNAATKIPVLSARPAQPSKRAENASSISADNTATLTATEVDPYIWSSTLPVSIETILMSGSDFEMQLPSIFADAFADAMLNAMMVGTGSGCMQGIFTNVPAANQTATGTSATLPTIAELHEFAVKLRSRDYAAPCIIMHPTVYTSILATAPSGYDPRYNDLVSANPSIAGVPVYLTNKAVNAASTGDIACVGCDLSEYAIGAVGQLTVRPVETPDSTSVFYKAYWAFSGSPIVANNLVAIKLA